MQIREKSKDYLLMLSKLEIDFRLLVLFFAGLFSGLSISSIFLIPLLVFGYYIFIKNLEDSKGFRVSIIYGLIFGFAFFLGSMHWIIFPFLVYENHFYLAPVIALIFPALMGIFFSCLLNILEKTLLTFPSKANRG